MAAPAVTRQQVPPPADERLTWRERSSSWDLKFAPYVFVSPYFILFGLFGAFPIVYTLWVSLHDWPILGDHSWSGLGNYERLLSDENFHNALINTVGMFVVATIPQLLLALGLATILDQRLRLRTFWRLGVLVPNVTSVAAVGLIFTLIFARDFGLMNWLLGGLGIEAIDWQSHQWSSWLAISTMVDWRWTGYNALILLAAMQAIPQDLYDAADVDGASKWRQLFAIRIPMLRPTLIFVVIVSTIGGMQLFTEPLIFNSGPNAISGGTQGQSQTVTMYLYQQAFRNFDFGYAAAISWALFVLIAVLSVMNVLLIRRVRSAE
jgi:cellobiose transport system permease protein